MRSVIGLRPVATIFVLTAFASAACSPTSVAPSPISSASSPPAETLPVRPAPSATPPATSPLTPIAAPFAIRFDPPTPDLRMPFAAVIAGLRPGEAFELTLSLGQPLPELADGRGEFRLVLNDGVRQPTCFSARRADGTTVRASVASATACAEADAPIGPPDPVVVGPTDFFSVRVRVPVGTQLTFIGLSAADGRRIADRSGAFGWQRAVPEQPFLIVHRFSPEYEGAGPLPAGIYTWSYEVLGQRYDLKVTLAR